MFKTPKIKNSPRYMKKLILLILGAAVASAYGLPTYEPFTEFGNLVAASGTNLVVATNGIPIGTNAGAYISHAIDLTAGGLAAPSGEPWTRLDFSGLNSTGGVSGAYQGLDVAVISNSTIFTVSALNSLLPSTFPGFPAGAAITNFVENPAQPGIWNGTSYALNANTVGNSPVLRFSQDITRPATGSKTVYVSYLLSVAQAGQLGTGNDGRYLAFLSQSNLAAGIGTVGTYSNWFQLFNTFNTTSAPPYAAHGLISKTGGFYIGPCDTSAGKDFTTSTWSGSYGTPLFVVGAYQLSAAGSDTNAMWVNPPTSSFGGSQPPTALIGVQVDVVPAANRPPDIAGLVLIDRVGNGAAGGVGTNYVANLLVGTTWSYVTGGPEFTGQPVASTNANIGQTISLAGTATAAAQGVTYQWQKISNGTTNNLSDGVGMAGGTGTVSGSGTSTLTISDFGAGDVGDFLLVATASGTGYSLSSSVAAIALADPQIVFSPASVTTNYGGTASFTAQVSTQNAPLEYQWYNGSTPLTNGTQSDGSTVSGASGTTSPGNSFGLTLTISGVSYQDAANYTLYVTNTLDLSGATAPAALVVNDPYIVTQPASPAVASGGNATFTVAAAGSPTIFYQWYENGNQLSDGGTTVGGSAVVSGSQTATLTLTGVADADDGNYSCTVTGGGSGQSVSTTAVGLTVQDALTVVAPPQSWVERTGDHLAFVVAVAGGGPQLQWNFNGQPISGATNSALVLTNIQPANGGTYSVTVQNLATAPQSYSATLTVTNSNVLPLYSTNILVARVGDGAQVLSGATGNTLYLDQYTPAGVYVSTVQVPDEAAGAAYGTGSGGSANTSPALIFQGAGTDPTAAALLTVSGGNQEFIDLAGYCAAYPFSGTDVTVGATAGAYWRGLATINAYGVYSLAYTNSGLYSGGTHTIRSMVTLDGTNFWTTGLAGSGSYVKYVSSAVGSYATGSGIPTITAAGDTDPYVAEIVGGNLVFSDANLGNDGLYVCSGTPEPAPSINDSANPSPLISESSFPIDFAFSPDLNTVYIADGAGFGGTGSEAGGIERWDTNAVSGGYSFSYSLPVDPTQTLGALGLAVNFSAAATWGPGVMGAELYATTYGTASNSLVSIVDNGVNSTPTVLVTVGANNALRGVRFGPAALPPAITAQPQSQTNFPGNSVVFSVAASGSAPISYQWYGPNGLIPGATNRSFTASAITFSSAGNYYAVASNPTGTNATSSPAVLTVTAGAPVISPVALPDYEVMVGSHLAWAPVINGSTPITYSWYQNGNSSPVLTGTINTLGAGSGGLSLANIQLTNSGTYILVVTNLYGRATNASGGVLTVTTTPPPLSPTNLVVARIGDGLQALSGATGNTLYLDQYTPGGNYVSTIQVPDEGVGQAYGAGGSSTASLPPGSQPLLFEGAGSDTPYEGTLTLSPNGQNLTFAGYVQAYPFSGPDLSIGANGSANWRGVAEVNAYGYYSLAYTNTGLYSEGFHQIHSAADLDGNGTNFYATGEAGGGLGLKYLNINDQEAGGGNIASISGSFSGTRVVQIINGNLVFSDVGTNPIGLYGCSGLPTAQSTPALLIAETNSPTDFAASPDGSTVYIADNGAFGGTNSPMGGIQRWDGSAPGNYTYSYTLPTGAGTTVGAGSLAVDFSAQTAWGAGVTGAKLYVTTAESSGNRLIQIVDNGPASGAVTLVTASAGQVLRGVRFGPLVVPPTVAVQPQSSTVLPGASATLSVDIDGSGPFTYQWYFQAGGTGAYEPIGGATNAIYAIGSVANGNVGDYYVIAASPSSATVQSQTALLSLVAPPHFTSESYLGAGEGFEVFYTGTAGLGYSIYSTTNLTLGLGAWTLLETNIFSGGTDNYTDPNGGVNAQQFYIITSP